MKRLITPLRERPRLVISIIVGLAVALLLPHSLALVTRCLSGWNVAVWLHLVLVAWMIWHADEAHIQRGAAAQAEGAATVLAIVVLAALASLVGITVELAAAKVPGAARAWPHLAFVLTTVMGSWLLMPTMFALTYASLYYRTSPGSGFRFPQDAPEVASASAFEPDYGDFLYFSFTLAVAAQTSDVTVTTQPMRHLVLLQALLSFAFNTAILAFTINIAASMF